MALTNQEITNVLAHIENQIHAINQIDQTVNEVTKSTMVELKAGFDAPTEKKTHAANIIKAIRFLVTELGVTQLPTAYTRAELESLGVLEKQS